ncbi:hypothetical protein FM114_07490 [Luteococcus japonicus LSP_Lj1]|uniref:Uncharacterized protein n=1 Tax=Luteococcus japonicus LSP_Lj1 TaxID=1255658 RepID=A0A1R4JH20_9ACTN|nr:hypothetical protein FM114_07490 [Luteococcus japonicus LSP_Lj1]
MGHPMCRRELVLRAHGPKPFQSGDKIERAVVASSMRTPPQSPQ